MKKFQKLSCAISRSHGMRHDSSRRQCSDQLFQNPDRLYAHIRKDLGYDEISISNIPAKQNILKSNVKVVSGGSVIALDYFGSSSFKVPRRLSARVQNRTLTPIISTISVLPLKARNWKDFLQGRKQNLYFHHQGASLCQPVETVSITGVKAILPENSKARP